MARAEADIPIARILVALDASRESMAALEAAAALAAELQAELAGLFIEDIEVLHLAGLPFAREMGFAGRGQRPMDPQSVERQFRVMAASARRALESAAGPRRLRWSFRIVRGRVEKELLSAAEQSDMVAVGKAARPQRSGRRLGSAARAMAVRGPAAVLLTEAARPARGARIAIVYDASPCARRALRVAARLAKAGDHELDVLLLTGDRREVSHLAAAVTDFLHVEGVGANFRMIALDDPAALMRVLDEQPASLLVLGAECYPLDDAGLERLLGEIACPVLLIREAAA